MANQRKKISMVGSGMIGGTMGYICAMKELGDVVLFDVAPQMPLGKALDLNQVCAIEGTNVLVKGANSYEDISESDVVIVTAGITKIAGKDDKEWCRDDLLVPCGKVMKDVGKAIKQYCPKAFIIVITNPLDVMVKVLHEHSGVPAHMICGMAGVLDSGRFCRFIADALKVSPRDVDGIVMGAHGESMVPLYRHVSVSGIALTDFIAKGLITQQEVDAIVNRTKYAGKEIVQLLGQGSAYYAPATAAVAMAESFLRDEKRMMSCACFLNGEYGFKDIFCGVPCIIGGNGIEKIIEMDLVDEDKKHLNDSVNEIKRLLKAYADNESK